MLLLIHYKKATNPPLKIQQPSLSSYLKNITNVYRGNTLFQSDLT